MTDSSVAVAEIIENEMDIHFTVFGITSCQQSLQNKHACIYLVTDLYNNYDTGKFKKTNSHTKDWFDLEEYGSSNTKQLYQFDKNHRLRF